MTGRSVSVSWRAFLASARAGLQADSGLLPDAFDFSDLADVGLLQASEAGEAG